MFVNYIILLWFLVYLISYNLIYMKYIKLLNEIYIKNFITIDFS
jgi:hypothetical protein